MPFTFPAWNDMLNARPLTLELSMIEKPEIVAFSYVRFSSAGQASGDSEARQDATADEWCRRNGVPLDARTRLIDRAASAFTGSHRNNPDRNALASFLALVQSGDVPIGSYLILENLDRLTREHAQPALMLVIGLLQAGVKIVQLKPTEKVFDSQSDADDIFLMLRELSRGHSESAMKSERIGKAWAAKKKLAREKREPMGKAAPAWLELRDGRYQLVPERAAAVRRIFALAAEGRGLHLIVRALNAEGVPAFGRSGVWNRQYVGLILRDRRALGETQLRGTKGRCEGAPVAGYFPAVVTEEQWQSVRAGTALRRKRGGAVGSRVNLFAGLLIDPIGGGGWTAEQAPVTKTRRLLKTVRNLTEASSVTCVDESAVERGILALLREIDPSAILGAPAPDRTAELGAALAELDARIATVQEELLSGDVRALANVLRTLEARRDKLAAELRDARRKAAAPLAAQWREAKTLLSALDESPDPTAARLRLRSVLRALVDTVALVCARKGVIAYVGVQIDFTEGGRRSYLVRHRSAGRCRPEVYSAWSFPSAGAFTEPDLRRREDALRFREALLSSPALWSIDWTPEAGLGTGSDA